MVKRIGGFRRKTRHKLKKPVRRKGKVSISKYFQDFKINEIVQLVAEPSIQKGMYFPKFHGRYGTINKKKGKCYEVKIKTQKKEKILIVHPVHLKKI